MKFKIILGALLLLVVLVFSVQNAGVVEVRFFTWSFIISLALLLFAVLAIGLIGGWALTSALGLKRRQRKAAPPAVTDQPAEPRF